MDSLAPSELETIDETEEEGGVSGSTCECPEGDSKQPSARSMRTRARRGTNPGGGPRKLDFQGRAAAEYVRRISPLYLQTESPDRAERSVESLDSSRRERQELQLREDERAAARWIHEVTGNAEAGDAANGRSSLQDALRSGEALCDLVNTFWPGRVVGVHRGEAKTHKWIANIASFIQACSDAGVDDYSVFAPSDLVEGKNLRSVVRCIFALAGLVPEQHEGMRLVAHDAFSSN